MTTIAWDGKTLAADTLAVRDGYLKSRLETKIWRIDTPEGPALFGASGHLGAVLQTRDWLEAGADESKKPSIPDGEMHGLLVLGGICFCLESRLIAFQVLDRFLAVGTGGDYARCAMHLGKTAAEAIAIAAIFDAYTGGEITELTPD